MGWCSREGDEDVGGDGDDDGDEDGYDEDEDDEDDEDVHKSSGQTAAHTLSSDVSAQE